MKIYCDGATSNNGAQDAIGGWAYVILDEEDDILFEKNGKLTQTTNNICELTAMIQACEQIARIKFENVTVYSDSAYIINCYAQKWYEKWMQNGWRNSKKEPVANKNLWEKLIPFFLNEKFKFVKVSGHCGVHWNEYVDKMAVEAKEKVT